MDGESTKKFIPHSGLRLHFEIQIEDHMIFSLWTAYIVQVVSFKNLEFSRSMPLEKV